MTDYSDWKYFFASSWDPVTGEIPGNHHAYYDGIAPTDPLDQLAVIIRQTRELLGVDVLETGQSREGTTDHVSRMMAIDNAAMALAANKEPDQDGYLDLIRYLFGSSRSIYQYLDYYRYGAGYTRQEYVDSLLASALDFAPTGTPPYIIIGTLALKHAYTQGKRLVMQEEAPDTPTAWALLHAAKLRESEGVIQELEPLAETGRKQRKACSKGGRNKADTYFNPNHEIWQGFANEIWAGKPRLSIRVVADIIAKKTGSPSESIRRIIKKPA